MSDLKAAFEAWKRTQNDGYDAWDAVVWATERAATVCEGQADFHQEMHNTQAEQAADACATAIRGTK
jgi:hypothetical protein